MKLEEGAQALPEPVEVTPTPEALAQLRTALRKLRGHIGKRAKFDKAATLFRKLLDEGSVTSHARDEAFQVRATHVLDRPTQCLHLQPSTTAACSVQIHDRQSFGVMCSSLSDGYTQTSRLTSCLGVSGRALGTDLWPLRL